MTNAAAAKLSELSADYAQVTGRNFEHFMCPILFEDEDVELCQAHIVNRAFDASKLVTIQRKDVDNWYGSMFESDFADMRYRGITVRHVLMDRTLAKRFPIVVLAGGEAIPSYFPTGRKIPQHHTGLTSMAPVWSSSCRRVRSRKCARPRFRCAWR